MRQLLDTQVDIGTLYNRNSKQEILADVQQELGIPAADSFNEEFNLEEIFGIQPGLKLSTPGN